MAVKIKQVGKAYWLYIDWHGQRRAKKVGSKKAAEMARIQIEARLAAGGPMFVDAPAPVPSFKEVAEGWLPWYQGRFPVRPSTTTNYESFIRNHLIPFFGADSITAVTRARVGDFIAAKRSPGGSRRQGKALADSSLKVCLPTLNMILDYAVERGWVSSNPMQGAKLWRAVPTTTEPDPFSQTELVAIVGAAESLSPQFGLLIRAWAQSGMRSGEIRGLQHGDFDPRGGTVTISRTRTNRHVGPPKTRRSARQAALTFPVLEDHGGWQPTPTSTAILARVGAIVALDATFPLFPGSQGRPLDEDELHTWWKRTLRRAKVRPRPPETLRHSLVSILLSRGAPLLLVAQQTGHTPGVMLAHYSKWMPQPTAIPTQVSLATPHKTSAESAS